GGAAKFSGGTGPYTISLDGGAFAAATSPTTFNSLGAGSHTVAVKDANGCMKSDSITVNQPAVVTLSVLKSDITCNGAANGTITASATGGTTQYQFKLDGGSFQSSGSFIGVGPGSHIVMVKDAHGCMDSKSVTINEPPLLLCSITPPAQAPVCGTSGNSLSATVIGGTPPYNITWSVAGIGWSIDSGQGTNSITYTAGPAVGTATFTLKVTDTFGCMSKCTIDITCVPPQVDNCTLTQGFYGNQNGKFNGIEGPALVTMLLTTGDLVVGKPGRSLTIKG